MSTAIIENFSNGPVFAMLADNHGNLISEGWWDVAPNQSQTLTSPDASDMYLRVQDAQGNEITFANFSTFLFFPSNPARFTVTKPPDDPTVRVLKWGGNLENSHNMTASEPLPPGWSTQRCFKVGPITEKFQVQP
jgi:hypothetical protein